MGIWREQYIIRKYRFKEVASGTFRNIDYVIYGKDILDKYNLLIMEFDIVCGGCCVDRFSGSILINFDFLDDHGINEPVFFLNKAKGFIDNFILEN